MFDVGFAEILVLSVIGLLVLGPERLPKVARTLGGLVRKARSSWSSLKRSIDAEIRAEELKKPLDDLKKASEQFTSPIEDLKKPFQDFQRDLKSTTGDVASKIKGEDSKSDKEQDTESSDPESKESGAPASATGDTPADG